MATNTQNSRKSAHSATHAAEQVVERRTSRVRIPCINVTVELPSELFPYYLGVGVMAAFEIVEWPVALIVAAGHTIAARSRNEALRELGGGLEAGA